MSTRLRSRRLDELVATAANPSDAELAGLSEGRDAAELFLALISDERGPGGEDLVPPADRRHLGPLLLAAAAAFVLLVGLLFSVLTIHPKGTGQAGAVAVTLRTTSGATFEAELPARAVHGGLVDWQEVPSYVEVVADDKVVGAVLRSELVPPGTDVSSSTTTPPNVACGSGGIDVYGPSLTEVVGQLFPGVGYVPDGQQPDCDGVGASVPPLSTIAPPPNCNAVVPLGPNGRITQCGTEGGGATKGT